MKENMENKKYELVEDDFIIHEGRKLYRIRALKKIDTRKTLIFKGDIGGYIESYHNLSQEGECWIFPDAKVYGNARVKGDVKLYIGVKVYGNARIEDCASIASGAEIFDNAIVKDFAIVRGDAKIYGNASIEDCAIVEVGSEIYGNASIFSSDQCICSGKYCDNVRV
jgi:UDP-3-O-[3-hydroxymyristoyl] glucosamine N-acyltransferase